MCPRVITHADRQAAVAVEHLERIATKRTALGVEDDNVKGAVRKVAQVVFDRELNVRRAFQTWDANGSGDLDIGEFTSAMNSLGFSLDLVDAKHIFQLFDIDGDGRIKCWEFVRTLGQFEGQLGGDGSTVPDITDTVVTPPGHNTGKGGGGDPSPGSQKSKMAERSRQQVLKQKQAEADAERLRGEQEARNAELEAALAMIEAKKAELERENESAKSAAVAAAQAEYQKHHRELLAQQKKDAAKAEEIRRAMEEAQEALERARIEAEAEAAKGGGQALLDWLKNGLAPGAAPSQAPVKASSAGTSVSDILQAGMKPFNNPSTDTEVSSSKQKRRKKKGRTQPAPP